MDFSVIIPSRNRPELLRKAIESVLMQVQVDIDLIVVNDGSDGEHANRYRELEAEFSGSARFIHLEQSKNGHGPSGATNRGAEQAIGRFISFLDDDDYWTDKEHLKRALLCLQNTPEKVDVYFANQRAYQNGALVQGPFWLESLATPLTESCTPDAAGCYPVTLDLLLTCPGFNHLNTTIISRDLYERIRGMDENIRYENDLDFYLRVIDNAAAIRYFPGFVSRHHVPDQSRTANASTVLSAYRKMLFRTTVWDKALLFSKSSSLRKLAKRNKTYTLKHIATTLAQEQRFSESLFYARQALAFGLNVKWLGYCAYLGLRAQLQ